MNAIIPAQPSTPAPQIDGASIPLDRHPAAVYISSLPSERSRRVQRQALDVIAGILSNGRADSLTFPWHELRYQHVQAVRTRLMEQYAPGTVNRMLSALRRTVKETWRLGYITEEEHRRAVDVPNVKAQTLPAGRGLASGELVALLNTCSRDPGPAGARDAAIVALLYGSGLRREEVVTLQVSDYELETGQLIVRGKGRKERTVYAHDGAARALDDWLALRGEQPGALFVPVNKAGVIDAACSQMSAQSIYNMLKKRASQANVKDFSPHDLRRTFVSDMLDAGADIATVAQLAGHASVTTTARYDRRPEEAKRRAAGLLHVPYIGRGH
jgi:site-specific recombinase XerD